MTARRWTSRGLLGLSVVVFAYVLLSASALAAGVPLIDDESASNVGFTGATLNARINPEGAATTYRFEYGPTSAYGTSVPVPDAAIGSGSEDVAVNQLLVGLQAGTAYHYRVVATNAEGPHVDGEDHLVKTYPVESAGVDSCANAQIRGAQFSSYLPDCRAYELVSPPDKSGGNIAADPAATVSSVTGDAIKFDSVTAFGDATGIEGRGAEYVAQRGGEGWTTHSINPEQNSISFGIRVSSKYVALSDDLSKGVFFAVSPVTQGHPNVEKAENLYLRTDLLSAPPGEYELLSDAVSPVPSASQQPALREIQFAGASSDWKHIFFETNSNLTVDAASLSLKMPKAYEWDEGVVRLVGILPNETPVEGSVAGKGAGGGRYSEGHVRETWNFNAISQNGSRAIFEGAPLSRYQEHLVAGTLYMRIDHAKTVQLNVSERTDCNQERREQEPTYVCKHSAEPDPSGSQPAVFMGANIDDSKVLLLSTEALTDNAVVGGYKLYMYDFDAAVGHHLTLISVSTQPYSGEGAFAQSVPGMSEDGSYVYFVGSIDLLPGLPPVAPSSYGDKRRLYVWHDGTLRYVASHRDPNASFLIHRDWGEGQFSEGDLFRVSRDGKTIMFVSSDPTTAQRVGYDNTVVPGGDECGEEPVNLFSGEYLCYEAYVYNAGTERLLCVSCNPSGARPTSYAGIDDNADAPTTAGWMQYLKRALSLDGHYAFFDTGDALLPQDTNGRRDVYEYDLATDELHLISSGACGCDSTFADASPDGRNVFFTTHQRLVRADSDGNSDMYDARVEGGIPSQNVAAPMPCEGDDCQGPAKGAPAFSLPSSATFSGVGNTPSAGSTPVVKLKGKAKPKKHRKKKRRHRKVKVSAKRAVRRAGR